MKRFHSVLYTLVFAFPLSSPFRSPCFPPLSDPRWPFSGAPGLLTTLLKSPALQHVHFPTKRPSTHTLLPMIPPPLLRPMLAAMPSPAELYPPAPGCVALPADMATGSDQPPANYSATTFPSLPPQRPYAKPLPVVRQSGSGVNVYSDWTLVDFEASGILWDRVDFLLAPCPWKRWLLNLVFRGNWDKENPSLLWASW